MWRVMRREKVLLRSLEISFRKLAIFIRKRLRKELKGNFL
jgi:hypothetical protein